MSDKRKGEERRPVASTATLPEVPDDEVSGTEADRDTEKGSNVETVKTSEPVDSPRENSNIFEAADMFHKGKCFMLNENFESAVTILREACGMYSATLGDLQFGCAEVHSTYGEALFESWRVKETNRKSNYPVDETKGDDAKAVRELKAKKRCMRAEPPKEAAAEDELKEADEGEETPNDLREAFKTFEKAQKMLVKQLGRVNLKLGEVSILRSNPQFALESLTQALSLLSPMSPSNKLEMANIYQKLSIVHEMGCSIFEAEINLRSAKLIYESHLRDLEIQLNSTEKSTEVSAVKAEIQKMNSCILDSNLKLIQLQKKKRRLLTSTEQPEESADRFSRSLDAPSSSTASAAPQGSEIGSVFFRKINRVKPKKEVPKRKEDSPSKSVISNVQKPVRNYRKRIPSSSSSSPSSPRKEAEAGSKYERKSKHVKLKKDSSPPRKKESSVKKQLFSRRLLKTEKPRPLRQSTDEFTPCVEPEPVPGPSGFHSAGTPLQTQPAEMISPVKRDAIFVIGDMASLFLNQFNLFEAAVEVNHWFKMMTDNFGSADKFLDFKRDLTKHLNTRNVMAHPLGRNFRNINLSEVRRKGRIIGFEIDTYTNIEKLHSYLLNPPSANV